MEAKIEKRKGNRNVVIAVPEIKSFRITTDHDFIVLASDGIYDKINNKEAIEGVWNSVRDARSANIHQQIGLGVEYIIKNALLRRTLDNVTVVLVAFDNFYKQVFGCDPNVTNVNNESAQDSYHEQSSYQNNNSMTGIIKKRNPLTNNTHTSGVVDKARPHMISGGTSYNNFVKSGV